VPNFNPLLRSIARDAEDFVIDTRHILHQHPRLRWNEDDSLLFIQGEIERLQAENPNTVGINIKWCEGGLVVDLDVSGQYDRIILRADIDALPIIEATGLPCESRMPGIMHACGHDIHSAMLLGFAKQVIEGKLGLNNVELKHNLRLVFQRAEENPGTAPRPESGGEVMVKEDGVLDGIASAYGLHIWNNPEGTGVPGVFYGRSGAIMGNSGRFMVKIKARGGHVMKPHTGINCRRIADMICRATSTWR